MTGIKKMSTFLNDIKYGNSSAESAQLLRVLRAYGGTGEFIS